MEDNRLPAILFATGEIDKLQPISSSIPSPMIPLLNQPVMAYTVELLARQGIKDIFVCLHRLAGQIESYFGNGVRWGVNFHYLIQPKPWGTAGSLWWARKHLRQTFLAVPADALLDINVGEMLEYHTAQKSAATVVVQQGKKESHLIIDSRGMVLNAAPSPSPEHTWCDTGYYLFEPGVTALIPARTPFDIHSQLLPLLIRSGRPVSAYYSPRYWNPLDTLQSYQEAQQVFLHSSWEMRGQQALDVLSDVIPTWKDKEIEDGIWIGKNNRIHPSVLITPPVQMGENCLVGKNVRLGPDAVIGRNIVIDDNAAVTQSTVLDHTYIGKRVKIQNRIISRDTIIDFYNNRNRTVDDALILGAIDPNILLHRASRMISILLAAFMLVAVSPLALLVALWLKLATGRIFDTRPVVYDCAEDCGDPSQARTKTFSLLQFHIYDQVSQCIPAARWIKRLELQRIPGLWNVINGDMDLVGVSLLQPSQAYEITQEWQKTRWKGRPGYTGVWYVYSDRINDFEDLLLADAYYTVTRSMRQNLDLLLKTPAAWFRRVGRNFRSFVYAGEKANEYGNAL